MFPEVKTVDGLPDLIRAVVTNTLRGYSPEVIAEAVSWVTVSLLPSLQAKFDSIKSPTGYTIVAARKHAFGYLRHREKVLQHE
jgi:hypothetical protein